MQEGLCKHQSELHKVPTVWNMADIFGGTLSLISSKSPAGWQEPVKGGRTKEGSGQLHLGEHGNEPHEWS